MLPSVSQLCLLSPSPSLSFPPVIQASRGIRFRAAWKSITPSILSTPLSSCCSVSGGGGGLRKGGFLLAFNFCALPCSFREALSHLLKKQITWYLLKVERGDKTKQPQFGLHYAPLQTPGSMICIVIAVWEGGESNSNCQCFWGVSFLILRVAACSAGPVIQSVVLFKRLN